jgi:hypothetical protein
VKRFTATEKWEDNWFRKLPAVHKVFWQYILDRCDNAGVWKTDFEAAEFFIGAKLDPSAIMEAFEGRIRDIGRGRWWVVKFISFQCGDLSEKCVPHQKIVQLLKEHGLYSSYKSTLHSRVETTHKEEEEDKEEERKGVQGENHFNVQPPPGFPCTEAEARETASFVGCAADFAANVWNETAGRGFRDRQGHAVRAWRHYLKSCWNRRADWESRNGIQKPKAEPNLKTIVAPRK